MRNMRFKVGDQVKIKSLDWYNENKDSNGNVKCGNQIFTYPMTKLCGKITTIICVNTKDCYYVISGDDGYNSWTDEMIEGLVEEETKPKFKVGDIVYSKTWQRNVVIHEILPDCIYKVGDLFSTNWFKEHEKHLYKEFVRPTTEYTLPEGYIFKDENGDVINATKIALEKKKKEYPTTIEECCEILGLEFSPFFTGVKRQVNYKDGLLHHLKGLLIYRDAYWKLYGEDMGLGKPWEPDWHDSEKKYTIECYDGEIIRDFSLHQYRTFSFPTPEMRDTFKENFKSEIESCKELL